MANTCWLLLLSLALAHPMEASSLEGAGEGDDAFPNGDACSCISVKQAYKAGAVCGQGIELPGGLRNVAEYQTTCEHYWRQLGDDATFCHKRPDDTFFTNWCFVGPNCTEVSHWPIQEFIVKDYISIPTVPSVHHKNCEIGDFKLGDMKFEELAAYALEKDLPLHIMLQYAYPKFQDAKLADVQEFWGLPRANNDTESPVPEKWASKLRRHSASRNTMLIVSHTETDSEISSVVFHSPPYAVSEGSKLYWVDWGDAHQASHRGKTDWQHDVNDVAWNYKATMHAWRCVAGCEENSAIW